MGGRGSMLPARFHLAGGSPMTDTPDHRDESEPPYSEGQPTSPTERLPETEPPHDHRDDPARAQDTAGGWIPPGGGYTPREGDPSAWGAPHAGEAPTPPMPPAEGSRSEEHTSELQSH